MKVQIETRVYSQTFIKFSAFFRYFIWPFFVYLNSGQPFSWVSTKLLEISLKWKHFALYFRINWILKTSTKYWHKTKIARNLRFLPKPKTKNDLLLTFGGTEHWMHSLLSYFHNFKHLVFSVGTQFSMVCTSCLSSVSHKLMVCYLYSHMGCPPIQTKRHFC